MAKKRKSYAETVGGFGNVPGYGRVKAPAAPKVPASPQVASFKAVDPPMHSLLSNLPVDPVYDAQIGALGRTRGDTVAGLEGEKTSTLTDYGYNATYDGQGNVASLTFDPNNPFSRAALLRKHYSEAKTGTTNGMAARGQLYSGALVNAQNANDSGFLQSDNTLKTGLGGVIAGIIGRQRTAGTDYETGAAGAYGERVGRAQSNPNYNPATGDVVGNLPPAPAAPVSPLSPKTLSLIEQWKRESAAKARKRK